MTAPAFLIHATADRHGGDLRVEVIGPFPTRELAAEFADHQGLYDNQGEATVTFAGAADHSAADWAEAKAAPRVNDDPWATDDPDDERPF